MDGAARAADELGNRLASVNYVGAHPDHDFFDTLDDNERMLREWSGHARVTPGPTEPVPARRAAA